MQKIQRLIDIFGYISAILSLVLAILIVYDVVMRSLFNSGSIAIQELQWHIFDLIFLFAIGFTLKDDEHIRVDIIYERYPRKWKKIIDTLGNLLFIIPFSLAIIYFSILFVEQSFLQNEISPNPNGLHFRYIIKSTIVIGFFLLLLQSILLIIKNFKEGFK